MADPESPRQDGRDSTPPASPAEETPRRARTLGRGLEELSPLFLTRRAPEKKPPPADPAPAARERAGALRRPGTLLLRPGASLTHDQVVAAIHASPTAIERRLRSIDAGLPAGAGGSIDVLALDSTARLVVIDVDLAVADGLLVRGLDHVAWIARHLALIRRLYGEPPIGFAARPRLVLVSREFSRAFRNAARQIAEPEVTCVRCHGLDVSGWTGIYFEALTGDDI